MDTEPKPKDPRRRDETFPGLGQTYRDVAPYLTLGIQLAAAVVFFFLIGWWIDTRLETSPTFELTGLFLGFVGGMIKFFRSAAEMSKKEKSL
jgi:F0F1-type ATP synthase assembly protein I